MAKSKVFTRGAATPGMNMTPLIDVTFQLIIFFLLITKIVAEEQVRMIPPQLEDPKTREVDEMNSIKINVAPAAYSPDQRTGNPLNWEGAAMYVQVGQSRFGFEELAGVTDMIKVRADAAPKNEKGESTLEVVLRADAALYYEAVQPVMGAITAAGVNTIHLVAYLPDKGPVREGQY